MKGAVICLSLMCAAISARAEQARFGLVIGANVGEPGEAVLRYAERDASRFADVLSRFAAVPEENLLLLRGRTAPRVEAIFAGLRARVSQENAAGHETVFFVYYSGHADAQAMHLGASRLPLQRLRELLESTGATVKVMVVDACRSGELTRVKGAVPASPFEIQAEDTLASAGSAIITSSAVGEDAQESERLGGGVFSHHFVTGLLGAADVSRDARVTLSEAYRYAYNETLRTTSRARFVQHPTYAFRMRGREDLVVTRLGDNAGLGRLRLTGLGNWMLIPEGADDGKVTEVAVDGPTEVLVEPGRYMVRRRSATAIFEGRTSVSAGSVAEVASRDLERVPYGVTVRKGYDAQRRSAWALRSSAEVTGLVGDGFDPGLGFTVGARADFEALSLELIARYGWAKASNQDLRIAQRHAGGLVTALRLFDMGRFAAGFGLRLGGDFVHQSFETTGDAPNRSALVGRLGALLRFEFAPTSNTITSLSLGFDGLVMPEPGGMELAAVPFGGLGFAVYLP